MVVVVAAAMLYKGHRSVDLFAPQAAERICISAKSGVASLRPTSGRFSSRTHDSFHEHQKLGKESLLPTPNSTPQHPFPTPIRA